jgi:azurin
VYDWAFFVAGKGDAMRVIGLWTLAGLLMLAGCGESGEPSGQEDAASGGEARSAENPADIDNPVVQADGTTGVYVTGNDNMQYNLDEFTVQAGEEVVLTLEHVGEMARSGMGHNVVIIADPEENAMQFALRCQNKGGNLDNGYLPPEMREQVHAHTKMIGGGETTTITFTAPEETGEYPFVCTFPAHAAMMNGDMVVE